MTSLFLRSPCPIFRALLLPIAAGLLTSSALAQVAVHAPLQAHARTTQHNSKLRGELATLVNRETALIPITIILADPTPSQPLVIDSAALTRAERRRAVVTSLKAHAQLAGAGVVDFLRTQQTLGGVGPNITPIWAANAVATTAKPATIRALASRADIAYINYDRPVGADILLEDTTAGIGSSQVECGVELMGAPNVWNAYGIDGAGVGVAVVDTGCCIQHPDLINQIWSNTDEIPDNGIDDDANGFIDDTYGWDFANDDNQPDDFNSHGTHVSGTIVGDGTAGTKTGMAPNASLMVLGVTNEITGESQVWEAMQYALDNDADVLSASLGWKHAWDPDRATWREICENLIAAEVILVFAAGNEGNSAPPIDNVRTPGDVPDVITIGAVDCFDDLASFSSLGPVSWSDVDPYNDWPFPPGFDKPTISAPGVDTVSTSFECTGYSTKSGTSMATPHVAGAVALILEANPTLTLSEVRDILVQTSTDLGDLGVDNSFGAGRVDVLAAVDAALALATDLNHDAVVDGSDLGLFLASWGFCQDCPADFNRNGFVNGGDLGILLANWN